MERCNQYLFGGAIEFIVYAEAYSPSEAYESLVEQAIYEYGNDCYNGTISTCEFVGRPVKLAEKFNKSMWEKAEAYARKKDYGSKWEARCLDLGVSKYITREVKNARTHKDSPVYKTKFCVMDCNSIIKQFDEKKKADEYAKKRILDTGSKYVCVKKKRMLVSGTDTVSDFTLVEKEYKSKPKNTTGKTVTEKHWYAFYGLAGC